MREVKSCLDERAQGTLQNAGFTKVKQIRNYKKEQMMEARFTEIERDNRILLERMTSIMKNGRGNRPNTQQAKTQSPRKSLNSDKRKFSLMRITLENQLILRRLQQAESYYDTSEWETDFKKREKILKVMCEYPY